MNYTTGQRHKSRIAQPVFHKKRPYPGRKTYTAASIPYIKTHAGKFPACDFIQLKFLSAPFNIPGVFQHIGAYLPAEIQRGADFGAGYKVSAPVYCCTLFIPVGNITLAFLPGGAFTQISYVRGVPVGYQCAVLVFFYRKICAQHQPVFTAG